MDQEIGDGSVMYALTGLIPSTTRTNMLENKHLESIKDLLSDGKYLNDSAYVLAYTTSDFVPAAPSNLVDPKTGWKLLYRNNPITRKLNVAKDAAENSIARNVIKPEIMPGVAYTISDYFQNDTFNMVYVQKLSDYEIKLRTECLNSLKITTHKLSKEQILEIKKNRRELKMKIKEEERKRIELMQRAPIQYKFFRCFSGMYNSPSMCVVTPFSPHEIFLAKKCILNNIMKPPNYYDFYDVRVEERSVMSGGGHSNNQMTS